MFCGAFENKMKIISCFLKKLSSKLNSKILETKLKTLKFICEIKLLLIALRRELWNRKGMATNVWQTTVSLGLVNEIFQLSMHFQRN
jgi:hypothetical protein